MRFEIDKIHYVKKITFLTHIHEPNVEILKLLFLMFEGMVVLYGKTVQFAGK